MDLSIEMAKWLFIIAAILFALLAMMCRTDIIKTFRSARNEKIDKSLTKSERFDYIRSDTKKRITLEFLDENKLIIAACTDDVVSNVS